MDASDSDHERRGTPAWTRDQAATIPRTDAAALTFYPPASKVSDEGYRWDTWLLRGDYEPRNESGLALTTPANARPRETRSRSPPAPRRTRP